MTCFCCGGNLARATDIPEARWLRQGDRYCRDCALVIAREQLVDGWPSAPARCAKHREPAKEGS